ALLGLLIAAVGIGLSQAWHAPRVDGAASIGISMVLLLASVLLATETKALLIGEPARSHVREAVLRIAADDPDVRKANGVLTVQLGPDQVVAALSLEFEDKLDTTAIERCVDRVEDAIKRAQPDITTLFVKPQSNETWQRRIAHIT